MRRMALLASHCRVLLEMTNGLCRQSLCAPMMVSPIRRLSPVFFLLTRHMGRVRCVMVLVRNIFLVPRHVRNVMERVFARKHCTFFLAGMERERLNRSRKGGTVAQSIQMNI